MGRLGALLGLAGLCAGVMWVVAHRPTPQQLLTLAPVVQLLDRLEASHRSGRAPVRDLPTEVAHAMGQGITDYLATHPPYDARVAQIRTDLRELGLEGAEARWYLGERNLREGRPRVVQAYDGEWRTGPRVP